MTDRELLDEQIAYYRARAAEYGATSTPPGDPHKAHDAAVRAGLEGLGMAGRILELAAGTGQWTGWLAERADDLLVTDASSEMLELNRAKTGERPNVRYEVHDVFALAATHDNDAVFFGFFLSHVPPSRFEAFWALLEGLVRPGGRIVFVDEGPHFEWREDWIDAEAGIVRRTLADGTVHRAVKVLWEAGELERRLIELGWDASVHAEGPFFWGIARR